VSAGRRTSRPQAAVPNERLDSGAASRRGKEETRSADPRAIALGVIRRVAEDGAYSNLTLAAALRRARLPRRDRDLVTELTYGTIRRTLVLDDAIARAAGRPAGRITPRALALLRLGAYQLLFTRIPAHAAVAETVRLARARERGFVNAVLRALSGNPPGRPGGATDEAVALRTGLAAWGIGELRRLLGGEAESAAAALAERSPLSLRVNTCAVSVEQLERELRERGLEPRRGKVHAGSLLLEGGAPDALPGFAHGWFAVQDQASSFVVEALDPHPGERVLDACAGPGGKAGHIACCVGAGGFLVAADVSPARAALVRRTLARLRLRGLLLVQDSRDPAVRGIFDRVLVDAPCSGIGAARRRPELLWRPRKEDLSELARAQVSLVDGATELLRPGGRLVYSVCTFPRAETDAACDAILWRRRDLEPDTIRGPEGAAPRVRLWPHRHGTDAMFVAAFRRRV
jgi:16S rRNA (cytosine967-C5)-methyltransferase